ncbi:NTP transferase domain-containing protein [Agrobacterium sp. P15N1-A]|uniref:nucleotidyltransferase family protein n=1 Tax=Agrobacterium sp. P15N1-A TaxID=3342820 RepID=UPI0037D364C6
MKPIVGIVLLAAGMARRMRSDRNHKLLAEFDGVPLVRRSAFTAVDSDAASVTVVVGHRQNDIRRALAGLPVAIVANPDYATGIASSLRVGIAALEENDVDGALVMLADMPGVTAAVLNRLIAAFRNADGLSVIRAVARGKNGNPVILPRSLYAAIYQLEGDVGARHLIQSSGLSVIDVEIGDAAEMDIDTPEAVRAAGGIPEDDLG